MVGPAISGAGKAQNGLYKGASTKTTGADNVKITFRVAKGGKRIKKWEAELLVVCPGIFPIAQLTKMPMPTMKVKRNGRFGKLIEREEDGFEVRLHVSGKLKGKRVKKGRLSYRVGLCRRGVDEPVRWKAKRVRR